MNSRDEQAVAGMTPKIFAPYRRIALQHVFWLCGVAVLGIVEALVDTRWRLNLMVFGVAVLVLFFLPHRSGPRLSEIPELPAGSVFEAAWRSALRMLLDRQILLLLAVIVGGVFLPVVGAVGGGAAVSQIAVVLKFVRSSRRSDADAAPIFVQLKGPWFIPGARHGRWHRSQHERVESTPGN